MAQPPDRVRPPPIPGSPTPPTLRRFLWTCRAGFEAHLFEELAWAGVKPRMIGPALIEADGHRSVSPAFGRAGFTVFWTGAQLQPDTLARSFIHTAHGKPLCVQGWAVDDDVSLRRAQDAEAMAAAVEAALPEPSRGQSAQRARERGGILGQVVAAGESLWIAGVVSAQDAVSLAPGGRQRMRRGVDSPSRASMKLDEALLTAGHEPGRGEDCVDLGAAPGGWTQSLIARGARVLAVDPANLKPELERHPRVKHFKQSAFAFEPAEPVDWLFCDMAWRPLEVAQLLAKWARRGWAMHLVANIKLPMKDKNPILFRVRQTLAAGGWAHLAIRQLYHDRDEVTVTARRAI